MSQGANSAGQKVNPYAFAGVDTAAGDTAVELMKLSVRASHGPEVLGGVGGFAGLFDVSALKSYRRPLLASSTDGVGTKVAIASALNRHETIGQDLVGMVVDDIVVVGAKPLFMTDYIACGRLVPERIAKIVAGIAAACKVTGTALVGGETAEHPGLMAPDDYDLAGAAVGVVEADEMLGPDRVKTGDSVIALAASGFHSNGYSLVRHILAKRNLDYSDAVPEFTSLADVLMQPTRLYTREVLDVLDANPGRIHALSHVTGGGIAANLSRVLPSGAWVEVDRSTWSPADEFKVFSSWGGLTLNEVESTWNMGIGMIAIAERESAGLIIDAFKQLGLPAWQIGEVATTAHDLEGFETGSKGVEGGASRLVGAYPNR